MSLLPEHRRALAGRTHSRSYHPSDYDPVEHCPAPVTDRIYGVTVMGVCLAAALVHWWSS